MARCQSKGEGFGLPQLATPETHGAQMRAACADAIDRLRAKLDANSADTISQLRLAWWMQEQERWGGEPAPAFLSHAGRTFYREVGRA